MLDCIVLFRFRPVPASLVFFSLVPDWPDAGRSGILVVNILLLRLQGVSQRHQSGHGLKEALSRYLQPKTVAPLRPFLGLANFYCRFIKGAAKILCPLTDA
jgi:hypothetical protein